MTLDKLAVLAQIDVWCTLFHSSHGGMLGEERKVVARNFYLAAEKIGIDTQEFLSVAEQCTASCKFFPVPAVLVEKALEMRGKIADPPRLALPEPEPSGMSDQFSELMAAAAAGKITYAKAAEQMEAILAQRGIAVEPLPLARKMEAAGRTAESREKDCPFRNASRMALNRS